MNNAMNMIINNAINNSQIMQNPMVANAFNMYRNGDVNGLRNLAENVCKQKGMNVDEVSKQLKQQFGMR